MNTELFITRRIAFTRGKTFSRFIIRVAVAAVALSVTIMIVAVSMITGFQKDISNKIYGFWGHIHIQKYEQASSYEDIPISINQPFYPNYETIPEVRHIQVYARIPGIIKTDSAFEGIILKGIGKDFDWSFFNQYITAGSALHSGDSSDYKKIIISQTTADRLRLKLGDKMRLYFLKEKQPVGRAFIIKGIYKTGLLEYDKIFALVDIAQVQQLNGWTPDQVGGFEVFIKDPDKMDEVNKILNTPQYTGAATDTKKLLTAVTIKEVYVNIFDWLNLLNLDAVSILILVSAVAAINMITALLILILERTNMIGVLKSLGSSNWSIRKIFLMFAGYIITLGLIWGNVIGICICLIQQYFHVIHLPEDSYYISYAPINLNPFYILVINAGTLIICLAMLIIPSYLVARIQPVKAIRFN